METKEPLFDSTESALIFAFNKSDQCYERQAVDKLAAPATGTGKGLGGLDGAGQAGMIKRAIERTGKTGAAVITARYATRLGKDSGFTPGDVGRRLNDDWRAAIDCLATLSDVRLFGAGMSEKLRKAYLVRFFSPSNRRETFDEFAAVNGVSEKTARTHYKRVKMFFAGDRQAGNIGLEDVVFNRIDADLRATGVVGNTNDGEQE